ncbi:FecR family protein [Marinoscillum furvescens]|uniref:FecR family protein n=1 Tax=Marinoscillum furvescens DSM 4134 TaxID=1122208 RepID=A0A3D9L3R2_MARFU|nr:FecR domain-containing protein [Marinoscillum furvescens]REE00089.1 FecR family protein [Marinoscillum furvescens DSM 4134]
MDNKKYTVEELLNDDSFIAFLMDAESPEGMEWKNRIADNEELAGEVAEARAVVDSLNYQDLSFSKAEEDQLWDKIAARTVDSSTTEIEKSGASWKWLKIAAALIPIVMASLWLIDQFQADDPVEQLSEVMISKECLYGRKMIVTLPDGSTVKLNSGSTISYYQDFERDVRSVWLQGEAFFDVKRNPDKPFVIISGNIRTQVLGTSFNIKSYEGEGKVDVTVASGLVSVSRYDKSQSDDLQWDNISGVVLNPSELVSYDKEVDEFSEIQTVDTDEILAWKSGVLVFKKAPFDEIVTRLERWYGVEFEMEESISIPDGFTGRFDNKSLRRVLEGISYTSKFDFEIEGKKVKIMKQ